MHRKCFHARVHRERELEMNSTALEEGEPGTNTLVSQEGDHVQSRSQRDSKYDERDLSAVIELRVPDDNLVSINRNNLPDEHTDEPDVQPGESAQIGAASTTEKPSETDGAQQVEPPEANQQSSEEELTVNNGQTLSSSQHDYIEFSNKFGQSTESPGNFYKTWDRHLKQPFNFAYFTIAAAAIAYVSTSWNLPTLWLAVAGFMLFALAAFRTSWNRRLHPNDFAIVFSRKTKTMIRATAILFPIPFFVISVAQPLSYAQLHEGQKLFHDGKYDKAVTRFNRATMLNPRLEQAYAELADCYNFTYEYPKSLESAEKALQLDPTDGAVWASKAWALNQQNKYSEALAAGQNAVKFDPTSGEGHRTVADAYFGLGEYENALAPASEHARIHYEEADAFDLKADILEKLNRKDEAAQERAAAKALSKREAE